MLILGRREGDSILIEGGIRIVVVSCDRGGVRIGIEAPPELKILRGEIAQQVAAENQRATAIPEAGAWLGALASASISSPAAAAAAQATAPAPKADA
jgi:carbon storage regulator